jgi:hypothetical protein
MRERRSDVKSARIPGAWFRQPVLWLGAAIFVASLCACIVTIVLSVRHADAPVEIAADAGVMKVPLKRATAPSPAGEAR